MYEQDLFVAALVAITTIGTMSLDLLSWRKK